jgi:RsiW-degrading membrane proteinase PrsW (M82 family)
MRLLHGSPLRHRSFSIMLVAFLVVLLVLAAGTLALLFDGMRRDAATVFFRSLLGATALSVIPMAILWWLDRRERESPWLFAAAFLWGGFIATSLALPLNNAILAAISDWLANNPYLKEMLGSNAALLLGAPIAGPLVEECTKGLGVVLLFLLLRAEYDNMRDGFIYGAVVGAGFNWFEAPLYVATGYAEFGDAPWELQLGARFALFGLAGHALFSGLFGAFLGLARQTSSAWVRFGAPVVGLLMAIAAHAVNNLLPLIVTLIETGEGKPPPVPQAPPDIGIIEAWWSASLMNLLVFFPFVGLMLFLLWRSGQWERAVIVQELADESEDVVTPREYVEVWADGLFQTRRRVGLNRAVSGALVNAQHELAFRKHFVSNRGGDPDTDPLVLSWRDDIRELREKLSTDST